MSAAIVEVAVPINTDKLYSYIAPAGVKPEEICGKRVLINFNGQKLRGFAIRVSNEVPQYKVKEIIKVIDKEPVFDDSCFRLAEWVSSYYLCGVGEVLSLIVPKGIKYAKKDKNKCNYSTGDINSLSEDQEAVFSGIINDADKNEKNRFYLYGVTGSGKTEVYIKLIKHYFTKNKSVIVLVPEIGLSYQIFDRIQSIFNDNCAIIHSGLSTKRRFEEYMRIFTGEAVIVVGTRSAILAPVKNLGLIIVDEEHEHSYKSEETPRFNARTVAQKLALDNKALLVMGSATPSLEGWYFSQSGYFNRFELNKRFGGIEMPSVKIVEFKSSGYNFISPYLRDAINETINSGYQVLLLQNRRGYSINLSCKNCGHTFACQKCEINLTFHRVKGKLCCHRCGQHFNVPDKCPECGSDKFIMPGVGTQKIEDHLEKVFGNARIIRVDIDAINSKNSIKTIVEDINSGKFNLIIGTQMISKGFDFKNIKLVGIVDADISLNVPDFRATERTFALLTQVAGRSGRSGTQGSVIIQTVNPEHYSITAAINNNYQDFFENEAGFRKTLDLPPYYRLAKIVFKGKNIEAITAFADKVYTILNSINEYKLKIDPPVPCIYYKNNLLYRFQIVIKYRNHDELIKIIKNADIKQGITGGVRIDIDIDPNNLL